MTDTASTIIAIIADKALLNAKDLTPQMPLAELEIDSLCMVEAIFAMEEAFDITIPFTAQDGGAGFDISTIGAIIAGVEGLIAQKAA